MDSLSSANSSFTGESMTMDGASQSSSNQQTSDVRGTTPCTSIHPHGYDDGGFHLNYSAGTNNALFSRAADVRPALGYAPIYNELPSQTAFGAEEYSSSSSTLGEAQFDDAGADEYGTTRQQDSLQQHAHHPYTYELGWYGATPVYISYCRCGLVNIQERHMHPYIHLDQQETGRIVCSPAPHSRGDLSFHRPADLSYHSPASLSVPRPENRRYASRHDPLRPLSDRTTYYEASNHPRLSYNPEHGRLMPLPEHFVQPSPTAIAGHWEGHSRSQDPMRPAGRTLMSSRAESPPRRYGTAAGTHAPPPDSTSYPTSINIPFTAVDQAAEPSHDLANEPENTQRPAAAAPKKRKVARPKKNATRPRATDSFLVRSRGSGMTYKEIKEAGHFVEAESTLRGRYRTLTKARGERVRRPVWTDDDISLLKQAVAALGTREPGHARSLARTHGPAGTADVDEDGVFRVSWREVADFIAVHGGSYHFGFGTCRKKWDEVCKK